MYYIIMTGQVGSRTFILFMLRSRRLVTSTPFSCEYYLYITHKTIEYMNFAKSRQVKSPKRGTPVSAGIDFYLPKLEFDFLNDLQRLNPQNIYFRDSRINPKTNQLENCLVVVGRSSILIPSGIHTHFPDGKALVAFNKSGMASKNDVVVGACVIDSDYTGELHLDMKILTDKELVLFEDRSVVQFLLLDINLDVPNEVDLYSITNRITDRNDGGFGSTES